MSQDVSIAVTMKDAFSDTVKTMRNAFDKRFEEALRQK